MKHWNWIIITILSPFSMVRHGHIGIGEEVIHGVWSQWGSMHPIFPPSSLDSFYPPNFEACCFQITSAQATARREVTNYEKESPRSCRKQEATTYLIAWLLDRLTRWLDCSLLNPTARGKGAHQSRLRAVPQQTLRTCGCDLGVQSMPSTVEGFHPPWPNTLYS